jgi:hypothetical protein
LREETIVYDVEQSDLPPLPKPESVFLGPLLDNVLRAGITDTKALLVFYGIFFDRLLIADAPLLNHPIFYSWYSNRNARKYLEAWLSRGFLVPCLRDSARDFVDLTEAQDRANMVGRITLVTESKQEALSYARFLDQCSQSQPFSLAAVSANLKDAVKEKLTDDKLLKAAGLYELSGILHQYVDFLLDNYGGLTRSNLYHFAEPKSYEDRDIDKDVSSFARSKGISVASLHTKVHSCRKQLKSLADALYNGNLPLHILRSSVAVPRPTEYWFSLAWCGVIPDEVPRRSEELLPISIDSTLLLSQKSLANLGAKDLEMLRLGPQWQDYVSSIRTNKNDYDAVKAYAQVASSYVTDLLVEKHPALKAMRGVAKLLGRLRDLVHTSLWEIAISAVLPPGIALPPWSLEYSFIHAELTVSEQHERKSQELGQLVKADVHLAVSEITRSRARQARL